MSLSTEASIVGFLDRIAVPQRLAQIYEALKANGVSKSTLYRYLERLVDQQVLIKENEGYLLVAKGKSTIKATDLSRLSEMEPQVLENTRGLRIRGYSKDKDLAQVNWQNSKGLIRKAVGEILTQVDPVLANVLENKSPSPKAIQKLVGLRFAILVSFDGTDFTALSGDDITEKRREAMRLLAQRKRMTQQGMADELGINVLQVRQLLHPLLVSGYAAIDDEGQFSYTMEVTPD